MKQPKFQVGSIVEMSHIADEPYMVTQVQYNQDDIQRYKLQHIRGFTLDNIAEYELVPARPAGQSKYGDPAAKEFKP